MSNTLLVDNCDSLPIISGTIPRTFTEVAVLRNDDETLHGEAVKLTAITGPGSADAANKALIKDFAGKTDDGIALGHPGY